MGTCHSAQLSWAGQITSFSLARIQLSSQASLRSFIIRKFTPQWPLQQYIHQCMISLCLHVGLRSFVIGKFTPQWLLQHIHQHMISLCLYVPQKLKPNILNHKNSKQCYILCFLVWVAWAGVWSMYWDNLSIMRVKEQRLNNLVSVSYFIQGKATYAQPVEIGS